MRVVTWNCRGALHTKWDLLLALAPDVAIVQECAAPEVLRRKAPDFVYESCDWHGTTSSKGLAVFAFGEWKVARDAGWSERFHIFLPERLSGPADLNLLAVWAFNGRAKKVVPNPSDIHAAIAHYRPFLSERHALVAGDFNASVVWDRPSGLSRFADLDSQLRQLGLISGYHRSTAANLGREQQATHFHVSGRDYHIDYIYHPIGISAAQTVVGGRVNWASASDHAPLTLEFTPSVVQEAV